MTSVLLVSSMLLTQLIQVRLLYRLCHYLTTPGFLLLLPCSVFSKTKAMTFPSLKSNRTAELTDDSRLVLVWRYLLTGVQLLSNR